MTDVMMRNDETGQFEPTTEAEVAESYVARTYGVTIDTMYSAYDRLESTIRGRLLF